MVGAQTPAEYQYELRLRNPQGQPEYKGVPCSCTAQGGQMG